MAYTLKASGIATNLVMCVAVDQDGITIKEFVSTTIDSNKTLGTGVAGSVSVGQWKGATRSYWSSFDDGTGFNFHGVHFPSGNRPTLFTNNANGFTLWEAYHSMGSMTNTGGLICYSGTGDGGFAGMRRNSNTNGKLELWMSASQRGSGSTTLANATKLSAGLSYDVDDTTTSTKLYFGAETAAGGEDGTLRLDGTADHDGFGSASGEVYGIGGFPGQGTHPASRYCSCLFNRVLTLAEMQSLHNDWFNTLFDAPAVTLRHPLAGKFGAFLRGKL